MMKLKNDNFMLGLVGSIILHAVVILGLTSFRFHLISKPKPIEVTYEEVKPPAAVEPPKQSIKKLSMANKEKQQRKYKKIVKDNDLISDFDEDIKDISKIQRSFKPQDAGLDKVLDIDSDRKITIPFMETEKITSPQYLSYNQVIRRKIREKAFTYIDHPDFQKGKVYLTFILSKEGALKGVKVIENKTFANDYLKEVGQKSIEESAPFPPFPEDLNYSDLTFNVVISFEVNE